MSLLLLFAGLALLLVAVAAVLFIVVIFRRERQAANLVLGIFLMCLAAGVWWTAIRTPLAVP